MNERLVFLSSILIAELGTSASLYLLLPESPLVRRYPELAAYMAAHAIPSLGFWGFLAALSAVIMPKLWRRRQNRSTKLSLLARIGLVGVAIDLGASLYLWSQAEVGAGEVGSPVVSYAVRLGAYVAIFALAVGIADLFARWHERRNPPSATPPPRFGRA